MLVFKGADGEERSELIHHFDAPGVIQGVHNLDKSIESFARCCFNYALDTKAGFVVWRQGYNLQDL